jgi:hypothetical protein
MEILNLGGSYEPSAKSRKTKFKVLLGVGLVTVVMGMGSTLAASITLSSGSPIEFGQGVATTTACDSSITVTPYSTYVNDTATADFLFSSVALSNIDTTTAACGGKTFVLKAYTDSSTIATNYAVSGSLANPLFLGWKYASGASGGNGNAGSKTPYNSGIAITLNAGGTTCTVQVLAGTSGSADISGAACTLTAGTITLTLGDGGGGAAVGTSTAAVTKITVESSSSVPSGYVSTTVA